MKLLARSREHRLERFAYAIRRLAGEHNREEELRVEPEPYLLDHLDDVIGGEPLGPVVLVMKPVERGKRHDAGVEPAVADLFHSLALGSAFGATDDDLVDPRAM